MGGCLILLWMPRGSRPCRFGMAEMRTGPGERSLDMRVGVGSSGQLESALAALRWAELAVADRMAARRVFWGSSKGDALG